jgi:hypothetical protein
MLSQFIIPGIVFLLTLASGAWLSRAGKPLNPIIFNVHKLIALAAVVATAVQTYSALKAAQAILIVLLILAGLSVVALFVTGALMSMNKPVYGILLTIHNVAPFVAVIAMALAIYLLRGATSCSMTSFLYGLGYFMLGLLPLTFLAGFAYDSERE